VSRFVLDASALLVLLGGEPGSAEVEARLAACAMSAVNLSEVVGKLAERGMPDREIEDALGSLGLEIHDFDAEAAFAAGKLRRSTRQKGLSLGDRACLALGIRLGVPILTSDRSWKGVEPRAKVIEIR